MIAPKIAFICSRSIHEIGGIENFMRHLCPILSKKGFSVVLYTEGEDWNRYSFQGVLIQKVPTISNKFFSKILLGIFSTIHALIFHSDAKIFHFNANAAGFSSIFPLLFKKKVVFQGHGREWGNPKWSFGARVLIKCLDFFIFSINSNFTMVSKEQTDFLWRKFQKKALTIPPGVFLPSNRNDSLVLKRFSLQEKKYILFLGRLTPVKRVDLLIQAFNKINFSGKLVIGGSSNDARYLRELQSQASHNSNIVFLGPIFGCDKEKLLDECLCFCLPSESEGLPISLLEAMSHRAICLASNIKGNMEALGDAGIYFEKNDLSDLIQKLDFVVRNIPKFSYLREKAYNLIEQNYTWEKIGSLFCAFYKEILSR